MEITNSYLKEVYESLKKKDGDQKEFLQAVEEVLVSLEPVLEVRPEIKEQGIIERLVEPERIIMFRVPWVDDNGKVQVNRGYRIQHNSAIGPYKGGLRFNKTVNLSILKFLAFEQTFKNSLTGLPMGGGKGGSDFDPHDKSDAEIMRFCQSFMMELSKHIGANTDVPAGDLGVGRREIGFLFGAYKRLQNRFDGTLTGKDISFGGLLGRTEATGYGLCYFTDEMLRDHGTSFEGKTVIISGSGNVAQYACAKASEYGAKVVAMSDSKGYVYNPDGIDYKDIVSIKDKHHSIEEYVSMVEGAVYVSDPSKMFKEVKCDICLPCATQNEIDLESAKALVANGCKVVAEGANMPSTTEAINYYLDNGVLFGPAKAANAGGVMCSGFEMNQNATFSSWTFEQTDAMLSQNMRKIYHTVADTAKKYDKEDNYVVGANIAGFEKVANAMLLEGII